MCQVKYTENSGKISVISPYNPDLPREARALGGKWSGGAWVFDARLTEDVAALYRGIYGEWPGDVQDYVTVRATAQRDMSEWHSGIFLFGRCLARAFGRDSGARLGDGVILRSGRFDSGGSMKNWTTRVAEGTVVEIMDVPRASVVEPDADDWAIEVIEAAAAPAVDRAALETEKQRLLERIAQIDALLAGE